LEPSDGRRLVDGIFLQTNSPRRLAIRPLPRFVGGADITLELRRAGLTIDRQALRFEWIGGCIGSPTSGIRPDGTAADQEALLSEFSQWLSKRSGRQD
jgi:hypothetical protein